MLKLLNKYSVSSALAAAVAMGASQAYATLTFNLVVDPSHANSISNPVAGQSVLLDLFYTIDGTGPGVYDAGGSFVSTGDGTFSGAQVAPAFQGAGFQNGSLGASSNIWGDPTNPNDTPALFYARSALSGASAVPQPVTGSGNVLLGTITYTYGPAEPTNFTLNFSPRWSSGVANQLWQENGLALDDSAAALTSTPVSVSSGPSIATWQAPGSTGDIGLATNWTTGVVPNSTTAAVVFGAGSSAQAVTNSAPHTFNNVTFNGNGPYTISSPNSSPIIMNGTSPTITVNAGTSAIITAPLTLTANGLIKTGTGNLSVNNLLTTGTVSINAGEIIINGAGGPTNASKVNGLTIQSGAALDLRNGAIIISNSSIPAVQAMLSLHEIISSTAVSPTTGIGYGLASDSIFSYLWNNPTNSALGGTFEGQTFGPNDILVRYTYLGDADLNGLVNFNDFSKGLLVGYGTTSGATWDQGDFDGNGSVNFNDFSKYLLVNYSSPGLLSDGGGLSLNSTFAAVPEPASLALFGLGAVALLARRRR